jgi:FdhD protein
METTIYYKNATKTGTVELIAEEPLSIRVQGKPYTVVMRTPGDEINHLAGFCLGEGIVDLPSDIETIGYCGEDTNTVTITLTHEKENTIRDILLRSGFISQTSCGICGKEILADLKAAITPFGKKDPVNPLLAMNCLNSLTEYQPLRKKTRAAHAAAIFDRQYSLLSVAEDVGRHNALDKAIGRLFLENRLQAAGFLVLSSRISYEMVQKAARAGISSVFAMSKPTSLAVALADGIGMTLGSLSKNGGMEIFC